MRERAVTFGGGRVLGVLTESGDGNRDRPCLVVLNAGLIHRVGPGRLSVEIARCAASAGYSAFRFDLSGLGDAAPRVSPLGVEESAVADVKEALDHLAANHGFRSFVLLGLCSGAVHVHHATVADDRIKGAVLLDGYSYPTLRFRLSAMADRLRSPLLLLRSMVRRAVRFLSGARAWRFGCRERSVLASDTATARGGGGPESDGVSGGSAALRLHRRVEPHLPPRGTGAGGVSPCSLRLDPDGTAHPQRGAPLLHAARASAIARHSGRVAGEAFPRLPPTSRSRSCVRSTEERRSAPTKSARAAPGPSGRRPWSPRTPS